MFGNNFMGSLVNNLMTNLLNGKFKNEMQSFNQMMSGKTTDQQIQTLLNMAKSRGFDINQKMFSEADLKAFGINSSIKNRVD